DRHDNVVGTKPQRYHVRDIIVVALLLGSVSTMFDFAFFGYFVGQGQEVLRTMWFMGSSLTELILLFSIRTMRPFWRAVPPAPILVFLSLVAAFCTIALPFTPIGHSWLGFTTPSYSNMVVVGSLVLGYFVVTEIAKLLTGLFIHEGGKK
ncbi:MAG: cation transporting ATPase C-terminal domain-containing protein, partial [Patescibacteria group bacterium]